MYKIKNLISLILVLAICLSVAMPIGAADVTDANGTAETPVVLNVEAARFSVTVPTGLPVNVTADGTVSVADDAKIINNSHGAVKVVDIAIESVGNWTIAHHETDLRNALVNSNQIGLVINNCQTTGANAIAFSEANFSIMMAKDDNDSDNECPVVYNAKVSPLSEAFATDTVANVVFTVDWNKNSFIPVTSTNSNGEDLNATSYEITGSEKTVLLNKLEESGIVDKGTNVDALIEVNSDDFDDLAETTFNVSNIAKPGDKVVILHYDETRQEWEYIGEGIVQEDGTVTANFSSYSPVGFVVVKDNGTTEDTWPIYFGKYYELVGDTTETPEGASNQIGYAVGFVFYPDGSWICYWEDEPQTSSEAGYIKYVGDNLCIGDNAEYVYATLSEDKRTLTLLTGKQMKLSSDPELYTSQPYSCTMETDVGTVTMNVKFNSNNTLEMSMGEEHQNINYKKISNRIVLDGDYVPSVKISDDGLIVYNDDFQLVYPGSNANVYMEEEYAYSFSNGDTTYTMTAIFHEDGTIDVYANGTFDNTYTYEIQGSLLKISVGQAFAISDNRETLTLLTMERDAEMVVKRVNA